MLKLDVAASKQVHTLEFPISREPIISEKLWGNIFNVVISAVPADGLAPHGAKASVWI